MSTDSNCKLFFISDNVRFWISRTQTIVCRANNRFFLTCTSWNFFKINFVPSLIVIAYEWCRWVLCATDGEQLCMIRLVKISKLPEIVWQAYHGCSQYFKMRAVLGDVGIEKILYAILIRDTLYDIVLSLVCDFVRAVRFKWFSHAIALTLSFWSWLLRKLPLSRLNLRFDFVAMKSVANKDTTDCVRQCCSSSLIYHTI